MVIYNPNGSAIIDIEVDDTSYCLQAIMDSDDVQLEFSLTEHVELPIGAYIDFQGCRYWLLKDENVTINHSRDLKYKVLLSGPLGRAKNYIIHNPVDHRLKFDLTAKPDSQLAMIIANLNERDGAGTWTIGTCISRKEINIPYNHTYCIDGLKQLADKCSTEFEIVRLTPTTFSINLGKVEYFKNNPLALGYGCENGFVPGISREESSEALEKIWIEGSEKNISLKEYGASILHLPKNLIFSFDGEKFEGEAGYDGTKAVSMVTDAEGYSVKLATATANATEGSLDVTSIYPSRTGLVKGIRFEYKNWYYTYEELIAAFPELTDEDWDAVQVDIVDTTIPESLDYAECLIANGSPLLLTFQSGPLAGREFDVTFCKEAKTDTRVTEQGTETVTRPADRFEIKKADHDGVNMPTRGFLPVVDNEYIITNCSMPQAYISDPDTFSGAEYDALREAARYLYENKDKKRSYRGTIDSLFAKRDWLNVSSHLKLGAYISFSHPTVQPTPITVRITSLKQFINKPEKPEIAINNGIVSVGKSTTINEIENREAHVEASTSSVRRMAKRSFADAKETAQMLIAAALEGFDPAISPVAIQTMQLLAGDESLQFKFWTSRACTVAIPNPVYYDNEAKQLKADACVLQHMTLGIDTVSPSHQLSEYKIWNMSAYVSVVLAEPQKKYYVYAKVDSLNDGIAHLSGTFYMSETARGMRSEEGYYYLLVGMLMAERDNDRSFAPMFGFTEILPGQITADRIVSSNGLSWQDWVANSARIGGGASAPFIEWNRNNDGKMRIHGALNVDGGGSESPQLIERGPYDPNAYYYWGNVITYQGSAYLNIYELGATRGVPPTDTTRWRLWISKGTDAEPIKVQYSANGTSWHNTYQNGDEYMRIYSQGSWGSAVKIKGENGHIGPDGKKAPYHDFMFGISAYTSASGAPSDISSWSDTPPATTSAKPYLWCRDRYYSVSTSNEWVLSSTSYYRLTGEAGAQGKSVAVQWSSDGSSWHDTYQSGDKYMRERVGDGTWSAAIKVVGEDGQPGADGKYTSFVFKNSWDRPSTPSGTSPTPSGWSGAPESADIGLPVFEGAWSVNSNVITSNAISHSQQTWEKIKFSTNKANAIVKIKIAAYSENNYDWGYICKLDSAYSTSNYLKRVSGTNQDTATITVANAGDHYIYVGYVKDGSQSVAPDQVVVEVVINQIWMSKCDVQNGVASGDWTSPVLLTGANGVNGNDGTNGNLTKHQWAKTLTTTQPAESEWKNDFSQVADHSGYYLWQRLLESLDGGVTWTVNTATVGIILDPTITKEEAEIQYALEEAARATVAEKLGYSSWESFSDAVAASQVLIQNGQINASLINTDLLIAKVVETSAALRRILIFNNEMNVIDDAENTVVRVHGGYNSSIYQFSNVSGSQSSVSFMPTQNTKQESSSFSVTTTYLGSKELYVGDRENAQYTGNSFTISNSGVSRMSGRIKAYLTTDWSNLSGFSAYSFGWHYVEARFYLSRRSSYCDYSANLGSCYASANGPIYTTKYVDFNVNLDAGTYYVFVEISGSGSILEQGMQDYRTKTYSGQLNASCQSQQNAAATVLLLQEKLEIFANGLGYRQSNNDYAVLLRTGSGRDASGYLQAEILSGVAGLRLGNNGSSSYLDAKLGKTWFSLVPKVMASWTWNGSSYVLQKWMVRGYNGSNTPYSIAVSDGVNFNLPSDYSGEQFSNSDIYIATAWSTESSRKDTAFVYKVTATQLIIKTDKMGGGMERVNVSLIVW